MCLLRSLIISIFLLLLICPALFAKNLNFTGTATPNGAKLSWTLIDDAKYYDIYVDNAFVERVENKTEYEITGFDQKQKLNIIIGARTVDNNTLDSEQIHIETVSWEGVYKWVNPTNEDNDGKMKELVFRVEIAYDSVYGQYNEIWTDIDGEWRKIFPFGELTENYGWMDFKGERDMEVTYRLNCLRFNTTSFTPSKWRIDKIYLLKTNCGVDIVTKAMGFQFKTSTSYAFKINEEGKRIIEFSNTGNGLAEMALFFDPTLPKNSPFTLIEV